LDGAAPGSLPDSFRGTAINITGGHNITLRHLSAKGYKVALMAKNVSGLVIEQCDFSYNYRQHLNSTQQKEDLSDWMSYHHNENDEWLRYGAAMYLRSCPAARVHNNKVNGGQCALMLTQCDNGMFYNNDFSFNSGIGIGMYRSSNNKVMYNRLDFNVRGHSEGVYNRGQDAAAILVFEQCNNNVFAYNSATHSGDGFFLWAGQTTMDKATGGCNNNLVLANDFSFAPTNGIEVTFSSNQLFGNLLRGCDNGIWAGYSYQTSIYGNQFEKNNVGIAIEHGQQNEILFNTFHEDKTAIRLWANKQSPPSWGYAAKKDTRSMNYLVAGNGFKGNAIALSAAYTDRLRMGLNEYENCNTRLLAGAELTRLDTAWNAKDSLTARSNREVSTGIPDSIHPVFSGRSTLAKRDRAAIKMTEWGPYDFRSPLIWNLRPASNSDTLRLEVIGPAGQWRLASYRGLRNISVTHGVMPTLMTAIRTNKKGEDVFIELIYTGRAFINPFGKKIAAGQRYRFFYRNNLLPANWKVNWYGFDSLHNPLRDTAFLVPLLQQPPLQTDSTRQLDYAWWSGIGADKQQQFVTVAETDLNFPPGEYILAATWEDAIRVYADGKLVLDEWTPAAHPYDESLHRESPVKLAGRHHLRVVQANAGGFATLIIKIKKK
ncbi:MAG TPA: right-handed parallel beta-helix repeat-containing protein, partial [Chitinophagaceae bacterium]|nr:right-handed parallel beta-helix repeat-containing protein [Chitinophagaceae bacterium]